MSHLVPKMTKEGRLPQFTALKTAGLTGAMLCTLGAGTAMSLIGTMSRTAQPPMRTLCGQGDLSVCLDGDICFFFLCWDVELYWYEAVMPPCPEDHPWCQNAR